MYHVLTLVRFGRFDEIPGVTDRPKGDIPGGFWDFAQGYAHLRAGETDFARVYAARVLAAAETSKEMFRVNPAKNLLGTVGGILEGELKRKGGDLAGAIASFERAVTLEDDLPYDEPEPLPFAARHWLGAALLEAGRLADAERVYREELEDHPHNGWSLLGLKQALTGRGMASDEVDADLTASWARSEVWTRSSRF
jgi:tetratricopeptide (TPR) repeat protein